MINNKASILNTIIEKNITIQLVENATEYDYTSDEEIEYVAEDVVITKDYLTVDTQSISGSTSNSYNFTDVLDLALADNYVYNLYKSLIILHNVDLEQLIRNCVDEDSNLIAIELTEGNKGAIISIKSI